MEKNSHKFKTRSFVSIMMILSGLGLPITGIANHIYGFTSLTVARHAWMAAHNTLGIIFVIFAIWHIVYNRRPLWNHFKGTANSLVVIGQELILAVILLTFVLALFIGHAFHAGVM